MKSDLTRARMAANEELISVIDAAMRKYPDMRFHQLLEFLGILREHPVHKPCMTNEFYTEPMDLLKRVIATGNVP